MATERPYGADRRRTGQPSTGTLAECGSADRTGDLSNGGKDRRADARTEPDGRVRPLQLSTRELHRAQRGASAARDRQSTGRHLQEMTRRTALADGSPVRCDPGASHSAQCRIPRSEQVRSSILLSGSIGAVLGRSERRRGVHVGGPTRTVPYQPLAARQLNGTRVRAGRPARHTALTYPAWSQGINATGLRSSRGQVRSVVLSLREASTNIFDPARSVGGNGRCRSFVGTGARVSTASVAGIS